MPINVPETDQKRVVIVGAGFAGFTLARKLAKANSQVVLIDRNNFHQFQPLFYQVAMAGLEPSSISFPLRKAFQVSDNIHIRVAEFEYVDPGTNKIYTNLGYVNYDFLVLALGAQTNYYNNNQIEKQAFGLKSVSEALFLRNSIFTDLEQALSTRDYDERQGYLDIVIVGGGPTGVELAGALAELKKYILPKDYKELDVREIDIYLLQGGDSLLNGMSPSAGETAKKYLESMGVKVLLNARVTQFDGMHVMTKDDRKIRTNKLIWAAGIICPEIRGIPVSCLTYGNRLHVDGKLKVIDLNHVYAIGDLACMQSAKFPFGHPQVAQVAIQQAKYLSKVLTHKSRKPFRYKDLGTMATIGRNRAIVDLPNYKFRGFFAWILWLFVHLKSLIGVKNKLFVLINWVWSYVTYDQSLRLIIRPMIRKTGTKINE